MSTHHLTALRLLASGEMSGRDLRDRMNEGRSWWSRWSGPAFYRLVWKMSDDGLVTRHDRPDARFPGYVLQFRWVAITEKGRWVLAESVAASSTT
jgi:DNA-binding PadR family transcriptional regulator